MFQWEDGERRLRDADDSAYRRATEELLEELRKRLGSRFTLDELADFYGSGPDLGTTEEAWLVEAAFARYAREASDFAGGRQLSDAERVEQVRPD